MPLATSNQQLATNQRILSGVQPTGNLHLGNYLGAIRNWVRLQDSYECLFMLADLHAITVPQDPAQLRAHVRETTAVYIACGIDPKKCAIFPQSSVYAHAELAWILSCHTPLGWLNRMTQFKDKINAAKKDALQLRGDVGHLLKLVLEGMKNKDVVDESILLQFTELFEDAAREEEQKVSNANLGLYSYPVLMASDILVYKATHVPVGEDQKQHLELCRDIAGVFNRQYQTEFFPLPEPLILGHGTRVMSLRDGTKKMSKSDESDYSRINLTDDSDTIALKFRKAKSDMVEGMSYNEKERPEASNLLTIYAELKGITREQALKETADKKFSEFKNMLTEVAVEVLSPITRTMRELINSPDYIDEVLAGGVGRAKAIADKTMIEIKNMVGFLTV